MISSLIHRPSSSVFRSWNLTVVWFLLRRGYTSGWLQGLSLFISNHLFSSRCRFGAGSCDGVNASFCDGLSAKLYRNLCVRNHTRNWLGGGDSTRRRFFGSGSDPLYLLLDTGQGVVRLGVIVLSSLTVPGVLWNWFDAVPVRGSGDATLLVNGAPREFS